MAALLKATMRAVTAGLLLSFVQATETANATDPRDPLCTDSICVPGLTLDWYTTWKCLYSSVLIWLGVVSAASPGAMSFCCTREFPYGAGGCRASQLTRPFVRPAVGFRWNYGCNYAY